MASSSSGSQPGVGGTLRRVFRWIRRIAVVCLVLLIAAFLYFFGGALYRRFIDFPREAQAWESLRAQRREVTADDGWTEFRGILHTHSELSHDSMVPFPDILAAAKKADIDFVFLSDHCTDGKADYSLQWKGLHEGVLFVRGFEMDYGFMPWGIPDGTVLDRGKPPAELAKEIGDLGGVLFFAHSEELREWDLPQLTGMEIYSIHTDFEDDGEELGWLIPDILLSIGSYGDQVMRRLFDRQTAILAKWDQLNQDRRIIGIAANDCHQNIGFRGFYTDRDMLLVRSTASDDSEDIQGEYRLNFFTRPLLRLAAGPLEPGHQLFRVDIDPYERSMRFVNTHILARELTEAALVEALRAGRVFVAFDMIADARGFTYFAASGTSQAPVGGELAMTVDANAESGQDAHYADLHVESPLEARFTLVTNGRAAGVQTGRSVKWRVGDSGQYRVEGELRIRNRWVPWIYTNPITITKSAG